MTPNKVTFFRNAAVVTIPAGQSNIIIPSRDSLLSVVFATFRANGCTCNLTQLIPDFTTEDPFEALVVIGASASQYSSSRSTVPGTVVSYNKKARTVVLAFDNGEFNDVPLDELSMPRSTGPLKVTGPLPGFTFTEFAKAIRLGGIPLMVERVAGEGTYSYAMRTDGFELTYDVDLVPSSGKYLANVSASAVLRFPSCVDMEAEVEVISKDYRLPLGNQGSDSSEEEVMRCFALNSLGAPGEGMQSEDIDPNLDALSIKGGELSLVANRLAKYSLGTIGKTGFDATLTQRLVLPVEFATEGYRRKGSPDSSVTIKIPKDGPNAVKLPQGQATVALGGVMLGTSPVKAMYPGQSLVLPLLKNEAMEAEVSVDSVGRQSYVSGSGGKFSMVSTVSTNITVTLKAAGLNPDAPECEFQVILSNVPFGASMTEEVTGCRHDGDERTIEINRSIFGGDEISVPLTIVYTERASEFQLDSQNEQERFLRLVVQNEKAYKPDFISLVDVLRKAIADKAATASKLSELIKKSDSLERDRSSAIDNLAKLAQVDMVNGGGRDQVKFNQCTRQLDELDNVISDCEVQLSGAQEVVQTAVNSLLEFLGQKSDASI